jgi:hypothetical protein
MNVQVECRGHLMYGKGPCPPPPGQTGNWVFYSFPTHTTVACNNPYCTGQRQVQFYARWLATNLVAGDSVTVKVNARLYMGTSLLTQFRSPAHVQELTAAAPGLEAHGNGFQQFQTQATSPPLQFKVGAWQGAAVWQAVTATPGF